MFNRVLSSFLEWFVVVFNCEDVPCHRTNSQVIDICMGYMFVKCLLLVPRNFGWKAMAARVTRSEWKSSLREPVGLMCVVVTSARSDTKDRRSYALNELNNYFNLMPHPLAILQTDRGLWMCLACKWYLFLGEGQIRRRCINETELRLLEKKSKNGQLLRRSRTFDD